MRATLLALIALVTSAWSPQAQPTEPRAASLGITLPIEVIGATGAERSISVSIPEQEVLSSLTLWLQVHNLSSEKKASIRVNTGAWMDLTNSTVTVEGLGKNYGGIGGAFATLRLQVALPAGALKPGNNTLHFRYKPCETVPITQPCDDQRTIGFRVLKLNFIRPDGSRVFAESQFTQEDPNTWQPPFTDAASIEAGKALWERRELKKSNRIPNPTNDPNFAKIKAYCMDCHTRDGRDLKYFNYSNHAIIERAKFHGLDENEGKKIASYIRTLQGVLNPGRPWNPPYQPGPSVEFRPVSHWAAGAGIDAVLEKDRDILPYLFPNFPKIDLGDVSTKGYINTRITPIPLQLPDWNHWLPTIHPKDAWGDEILNDNAYRCYDGSTGDCTSIDAHPKNMRARAQLTKDHGYVDYFNQMHYASQRWTLALYQFLCPRYPNDRCFIFPGGKEKIPDEKIGHDAEYGQKMYSTALWSMVKMWEIMQEFGLEGHQKQLFSDSREEWGWMSNYSFDTSPNLLHLHRDQTGINNNSKLMFTYFSAAWYQVSFTIYNGNHADGRNRDGQRPIDWPYAYDFLAELQSKPADLQNKPELYVPLNGLLTLWLMKAMHVADNGIGPDGQYTKRDEQHGLLDPSIPSPGWSPKTVVDISKLVVPNFIRGWRDITEEERKNILRTMLFAWFQKTKTYTSTDVWWRKPPEVASPSEVINGFYTGSAGNRIWYMLPHFKNFGVERPLIEDVAAWANIVWPQRQWVEDIPNATCMKDPKLHYYVCSTESFGQPNPAP
ncbi:hypothetical protein F0U60_28360 [Archangium minus]|uniref:Cytochrome c domain-containing protein n=1 Tax=Archangium minus TaxID=83450 RepID=A0ABY9WWT4_9BACT|nr:hypothetical protein F0U60_28360 [Archangium minus]